MTEEEFLEIFETDKLSTWEGDNAFQGLQIIAKYFDISKNSIICGADHDVMYSVDVEKLVNNGITKEDAVKLESLNWCIEDDYLQCFV